MHPNIKNLEGKVFGKLKVLSLSERRTPTGQVLWICVCSCGNKFTAIGSKLLGGRAKSCGCIVGSGVQTSHGMSNTVEYHSYNSAKGRCTNPKNHKFLDYGGRGIEFKFQSFEEFYKEVGSKPSEKHTLDRIENEGNYEPGNVRWATPKEQSKNKRKQSPGRTLCDLLVAYAKQSSGGNNGSRV